LNVYNDKSDSNPEMTYHIDRNGRFGSKAAIAVATFRS
jgi:hypothetical protein